MSYRHLTSAGFGALVAVLALLAACAPRAVAPPVIAPPPSGAACQAQLQERGISFQIVSERAAIGACTVINAVRVETLAAPFDKPAVMTCALALRLDEFETDVVQAEAQRYFHRRVVEVYQYGAYSCRDIKGTHRLSEHAHGEAIDIAGFELEGGRRIMVKTDWHGEGSRARFLHAVARGACRMFDVVLTPDANADHRDHIHVDLGPYKLCRA
jgi:hypothetical protein